MPFILTISEKNDSWAGRPPRRTTHATREDAEGALLDYVRQNWSAEIGTEPPDDPAALLAEYFDEVLERYAITEQAHTRGDQA